MPCRHYNISYPTYLGAAFDASTTNLSYLLSAPEPLLEPLHLTLSFLSPITPSSTLRQSIPAAYFTVHVRGHFNMSIYADVNGDWVSGNRDNEISWELREPGSSSGRAGPAIKTWMVSRTIEQVFTEWADRSEWGTLHFTAPAAGRHQCGTSAVLRRYFAETGVLNNTVDPSFRRIMHDEPVFAFAVSFGLGA